MSKISQDNKKEKFQNLPQKFKPLGMEVQDNHIEFDGNQINLIILILLRNYLLLNLKIIYKLLNLEIRILNSLNKC